MLSVGSQSVWSTVGSCDCTNFVGRAKVAAGSGKNGAARCLLCILFMDGGSQLVCTTQRLWSAHAGSTMLVDFFSFKARVSWWTSTSFVLSPSMIHNSFVDNWRSTTWRASSLWSITTFAIITFVTTSVHCSLLTILSLFLLLANCSQRHDHFFNRRRCAGCVSRVAPSALFVGFVSKTFCCSRFARVAFGTRCRQGRCNLICVQPTGEIYSSNVVSRQPICVEYY